MFDCKKISLLRKFLFFITLSATMQAEFMLLDQGAFVVSGPVGNTMITYSDVFDKLNLDGTLLPLDHQIKMEIIRQEVISDKMPLDDTAADKYLANIQKANNLSIDDLEELASQCHRTFSELKQLLTLQYTYDFFLYHKFRAHLVPSDQDVENYCNENPEVEAGYCIIQVAFVEFKADNKEEVHEKIDAIVAGTISDNSIEWSDPIKVNIVDIADDKLFIKDMTPGQINVIEDKKVFELYRLVEKQNERTVPISERKAWVIDHLNRKMYEDLLAKYEEHMMDNVAIIDLTK
ncbi:MAG: hypothetical protein JO129_02165 [Candidatus Dependentiae bacterium]|nr:hypothetical protein [Candidatus Dependentiae bacterium]